MKKITVAAIAAAIPTVIGSVLYIKTRKNCNEKSAMAYQLLKEVDNLENRIAELENEDTSVEELSANGSDPSGTYLADKIWHQVIDLIKSSKYADDVTISGSYPIVLIHDGDQAIRLKYDNEMHLRSQSLYVEYDNDHQKKYLDYYRCIAMNSSRGIYHTYRSDDSQYALDVISSPKLKAIVKDINAIWDGYITKYHK